jgi:serine/threonine-protein kinase
VGGASLNTDLSPLVNPTFADLQAALEPAYALERELGRGGMATVHLALDRKHNRQVAVKLVRATIGGSDVIDRFLREIRLTARLSHPHILPLLDSGNVLDTPFYVMPYVVGETLEERINRDRRIPIDEAVRIALEVVDALTYAHAQGVIHRDIKPANIMLAAKHALVADFGIAKAVNSSVGEEETQVGVTIGTMAYMSPEQAFGEPDIDARADIYALGVVLYEMLTGESPFAGGNARAALARRLWAQPLCVREKRPEVSEELDRVIARAVMPAPDDRYATAAEFEQALLATTRAGLPAMATSLATSSDALPSLAVLPFENLSGDAGNEYLSDGITEEILTQLSRRRTIRVCARASAFTFKNSNDDDLRLIGSRLGVLNLLLGSVRRSLNRLRVNARLVNARDGFQLWSERYDRTLDDVFAIEDEIGAAIVAALDATLHGEEFVPPPAPTPGADVYDQFLRGRALWNQRTAESVRAAIDCFEHVIAAQPTYAPGHAALADAWGSLGLYGGSHPRDAMAKARGAAETARLLDPSLPDPRVALGHFFSAHDWDWRAAEQSFRDAIALNPQFPAAHQGLATVVLAPRGDFDAAVSAVRPALTNEPLSPVLDATLAGVLLFARRHEECVEAAQQALDLSANFALAHFFLSQAHAQRGAFETARDHAFRAAELSPASTEYLAALGHALALSGDGEHAAAVQRELEERAASDYVSPIDLALIPLASGDIETALQHLEVAAELKVPALVWLGVRPAYDVLRDVPRYQVLLERMGLSSRPLA